MGFPAQSISAGVPQPRHDAAQRYKINPAMPRAPQQPVAGQLIAAPVRW